MNIGFFGRWASEKLIDFLFWEWVTNMLIAAIALSWAWRSKAPVKPKETEPKSSARKQRRGRKKS